MCKKSFVKVILKVRIVRQLRNDKYFLNMKYHKIGQAVFELNLWVKFLGPIQVKRGS